MTGDGMIQSRAQRIDIRPAIEFPVGARLFRTHVVRRTHNHTGHRQFTVLAQTLRDTHIHQFNRAIRGDHDIRGLDIAVQDTVPVPCVLQRYGNTARNV